jgi:hypothetical protein
MKLLQCANIPTASICSCVAFADNRKPSCILAQGITGFHAAVSLTSSSLMHNLICYALLHFSIILHTFLEWLCEITGCPFRQKNVQFADGQPTNETSYNQLIQVYRMVGTVNHSIGCKKSNWKVDIDSVNASNASQDTAEYKCNAALQILLLYVIHQHNILMNIT